MGKNLLFLAVFCSVYCRIYCQQDYSCIRTDSDTRHYSRSHHDEFADEEPARPQDKILAPGEIQDVLADLHRTPTAGSISPPSASQATVGCVQRDGRAMSPRTR